MRTGRTTMSRSGSTRADVANHARKLVTTTKAVVATRLNHNTAINIITIINAQNTFVSTYSIF